MTYWGIRKKKEFKNINDLDYLLTKENYDILINNNLLIDDNIFIKIYIWYRNPIHNWNYNLSIMLFDIKDNGKYKGNLLLNKNKIETVYNMKQWNYTYKTFKELKASIRKNLKKFLK